MRKPILHIILLSSCFLASCSTPSVRSTTQMATNFINRQNIVATTKETYTPKNPSIVTVYKQNQSPHTAYRVIGVATISRYNLIGMTREDHTLHEMMKKLAASIGGDGIIDISSNHNGLSANIIAFQKILI